MNAAVVAYVAVGIAIGLLIPVVEGILFMAIAMRHPERQAEHAVRVVEAIHRHDYRGTFQGLANPFKALSVTAWLAGFIVVLIRDGADGDQVDEGTVRLRLAMLRERAEIPFKRGDKDPS